jgi:hypothetical protein
MALIGAAMSVSLYRVQDGTSFGTNERSVSCAREYEPSTVASHDLNDD